MSESFLTVIEGDADDGAPVIRRPRSKFCRHHRFQLDGGSRRVYCGDCAQEVHAYDALEILAGMYERINGRYKRAVAETKRAEASLEDLKRQERNAKSRVRRANTSEPLAHTTEGQDA